MSRALVTRMVGVGALALGLAALASPSLAFTVIKGAGSGTGSAQIVDPDKSAEQAFSAYNSDEVQTGRAEARGPLITYDLTAPAKRSGSEVDTTDLYRNPTDAHINPFVSDAMLPSDEAPAASPSAR